MEKNQSTIVRIKSHLQTLGLRRIEKALDQELARAAQDQSTPTILLERLLGLEAQGRIDRNIDRRLNESKLPDRKLLADFNFDFQTGVDRTQIMELSSLEFVARKQSLVLGGKSGTGKSHIAKALLLLGCSKRYRCRYTTATDMLTTLLASRADNTLPDKLKKYTSPEVLLIDEVGFDRLEQQEAKQAALFLKVMEGRYCKTSTILTTNINFVDLGDYLGDPVLTSAMVDRLVHHAIIINIDGPSWRMYQSKLLNDSLKKQKKTKA